MMNEAEGAVYHPWRMGRDVQLSGSSYKQFKQMSLRKMCVRLKNRWNDSMQTLFLNSVILKEKQKNWNTYMQHRAYMYSLIN